MMSGFVNNKLYNNHLGHQVAPTGKIYSPFKTIRSDWVLVIVRRSLFNYIIFGDRVTIILRNANILIVDYGITEKVRKAPE